MPVLLDFDKRFTQQRRRQWHEHCKQWEAAMPDFVPDGQCADDMRALLGCHGPNGPKVQAHEVEESSVIYDLASMIEGSLPPGVHQPGPPDHHVTLNIIVQQVSGGSLTIALLRRTFQLGV